MTMSLVGEQHAVTPETGTMRGKNGEPCYGLHPLEFPVTATRVTCGELVRCVTFA